MNRFAVLFVSLVVLVMVTAPADAQELQVKLVSLPYNVRPTQNATIAVQTAPGAGCQIAVSYMFDFSGAPTLPSITADAQGVASWTFQVPNGTMTRSYPVKVTCSAGGQQGTLGTSLTTADPPGSNVGNR